MSETPVASGYGPDLAAVHHRAHGDLARAAAPVVVRTLRQAGLTAGTVVDLGCGSGILARALLDAGYGVVGVDVSPAMLDLARATAPEATFVRGSFLDAKLPRCCGVVAVGEVLNYALDPRVRRSSLDRAVNRVARALVPGGVFVFDLAAPGRLGPARVRRQFDDGALSTLLLDAAEDPAARTLTRRITLFVREGKSDRYRRRDETHLLHLFEQEEVLAVLHAHGFDGRVRPGYGRFRLGPGHRVYVATLLARQRRAGAAGFDAAVPGRPTEPNRSG